MPKMKYFFFLFFLLCSLAKLASAEEYTLSMLPHPASSDQLESMLAPLAAKLSTETGNTIRPVVLSNPAQYEAELLRGNIVIGYENPAMYVNVSNIHEVLVTAVQGRNGDVSRGIIIKRPESTLSLSDLKGKEIMIVSKQSVGGFLSQKQTLQENGINVEWDCKLTEAPRNKEENVILSVSIGDVDAGFINESSLHKADQYISPGSVTVIAKTAPLPNWAFSVNRSMPQEQKNDLREILLQLSKDSPALQALRIRAFNVAEDKDYDVIRSLIEVNSNL
ncbi:MAG: phosphate/phosphite/phosphonate ABC transporter substrate-binding protein [Candidatus Electrothrix sp. AR3]|nr:phosphate/phosphite/phosphonate ABC transporter substrate-binding protein [Candidatus Electrothrix sp. AR3]